MGPAERTGGLRSTSVGPCAAQAQDKAHAKSKMVLFKEDRPRADRKDTLGTVSR